MLPEAAIMPAPAFGLFPWLSAVPCWFPLYPVVVRSWGKWLRNLFKIKIFSGPHLIFFFFRLILVAHQVQEAVDKDAEEFTLDRLAKFQGLLSNSGSATIQGAFNAVVVGRFIVPKRDNIGYIIPIQILFVDTNNLVFIYINNLNQSKRALFMDHYGGDYVLGVGFGEGERLPRLIEDLDLDVGFKGSHSVSLHQR